MLQLAQLSVHAPIFKNCSLLLSLFPSISSSLAPQPVFWSRGMKVGESGWVKSRTHEILKSFLGSPHQHMLLSSLVHFLCVCFSTSLASSVTIPPTCGVKVLCTLTHVPHVPHCIHSFIQSRTKIVHSL